MLHNIDIQPNVGTTWSPDSVQYWKNDGLTKRGDNFKNLTPDEIMKASKFAADYYGEIFKDHAPIIKPNNGIPENINDEFIHPVEITGAILEEINQSLHLTTLSDRHLGIKNQQTVIVKDEIRIHEEVQIPLDDFFADKIARFVSENERTQIKQEAQRFAIGRSVDYVSKKNISLLPHNLRIAAEKYLFDIQERNVRDLAFGSLLEKGAPEAWAQEHSNRPLEGEAAEFLPFWMAVKSPGFVTSGLHEVYDQAAKYAHAQMGKVANPDGLKDLQNMLLRENVRMGLLGFSEAIGRRALELYKQISNQISYDRLSGTFYVQFARAAAVELASEKLLEIGVARGFDKTKISVQDKLTQKLQLFKVMEKLPEDDRRLVRDLSQHMIDRIRPIIGGQKEIEVRKQAEETMNARLRARGLFNENEKIRLNSFFGGKLAFAQRLVSMNAETDKPQ